jgi:hypothetical protein
MRVLVGGMGVRLGKREAVGVFDALAVGDAVSVAVGVNTYWEITSTVSAAMVFILEKAESTMFCGLMEDTLGTRGSANAAAETMQNRLNPNIPAASTVKGPLNSLIFTLTPLLIESSNKDK